MCNNASKTLCNHIAVSSIAHEVLNCMASPLACLDRFDKEVEMLHDLHPMKQEAQNLSRAMRSFMAEMESYKACIKALETRLLIFERQYRLSPEVYKVKNIPICEALQSIEEYIEIKSVEKNCGDQRHDKNS